MKTPRRHYQCEQCGALASKWAGQCAECGQWNTLVEAIAPVAPPSQARFVSYSGEAPRIVNLAEVSVTEEPRLPTGLSELDRVLGGGLVPGSVVLIGGDPGIGKSTLLLQNLAHFADAGVRALYVSGEESAAQIALRAERLKLPRERLRLLTETGIERVLAIADQERPAVLVIDSIQTVHTSALSSAPGSVAQVRECAAQLVRYAKATQTAVYLVGHVTKEGALAGPRVLEHMVDAVLYFEGELGGRYRLVRAFKNRFGAVNELGVFAMTEKGLKGVSNPSALFLSQHGQEVAGSCVMVTQEGTRPLLVEIQALVDESPLSNPRRLTVGLEQNRLAMLLAVLHRHAGVAARDQDVFVNAVGGVKIDEPAADLPVLLAIVSSLRGRPLPPKMVAFGEVGLAGEVRPVQRGQERLREASKLGFTQALVPHANRPRSPIEGMEIIAVSRIDEAVQALRERG
jgi:DNA repair protein RadA/Sms